MTKPSIEIPEEIQQSVTTILEGGSDMYLPRTVKLAEFLDQFIEKPIEAEPFVVYEVKVVGREERFLGFKSPLSAVEWTVAPYEFYLDNPEYLHDNSNPSFQRDSDIKVIRRIIPELEFGLEDKKWGFESEVLVKAKISSPEVDPDGDVGVMFSFSNGPSDFRYVDADTVALVKEG